LLRQKIDEEKMSKEIEIKEELENIKNKN